MSLIRIDIETESAISQLDHMNADNGGVTDVMNLLAGIQGGVIPADMTVLNAPVKATATLTVSATSTVADETFVVCGVTFTAKASGASGNQFNISTTDTAVTAANIVTAVNASASAGVDGVITASRSGSVVTFTADVPGKIGNGFVLSESCTGISIVTFAGGTDGTSSVLRSF